MAEENQNWVTYSGTDDRIPFEVINNATGLPIPVSDILGASYGCTPYEQSETPLISKDLTTGGISIPSDGLVIVTISKSDTANLFGEFTHELRLKDAERSYVASRGKLSVKYQVSNDPL